MKWEIDQQMDSYHQMYKEAVLQSTVELKIDHFVSYSYHIIYTLYAPLQPTKTDSQTDPYIHIVSLL